MLRNLGYKKTVSFKTGKKGRKRVNELTREQGAAQCSYAAWNLVPLSTC